MMQNLLTADTELDARKVTKHNKFMTKGRFFCHIFSPHAINMMADMA